MTKIKISYWTNPDNDDFKEIKSFTKKLSKNYKTEIEKTPTDTLGGGLYEFAIEIVNKFEFADIAKDIIEDSVKVGLGYFWKPLFKKIKKLFKKNKKYKPDIEVAKFVFNDITLFIYPIYPNSIDEVVTEVMIKVSKQYAKIKALTKTPIKSIHIPIFNHVDNYKICAFRVKLSVDENIKNFKKKDYFKFWGIKCNSKKEFVYNVKKQSLLKTEFYTQPEYDKLLNKHIKSKK